MKARQSHKQHKGFTIIELMIATMVFSVILLVVTAGIVRFTKQYYKGVISSTTQTVTRGILDDVVRAIQYNRGSVTNLTTNNPANPANISSPIVGYCIGGAKRYSFTIGRQVRDSIPVRHAFISDTITGCNAATVALNPVNIATLTTTNSRELLGRGMRLSKFDIKDVGENRYSVTIRIVYGEDDLLCSPKEPNDCITDGNTGYPNNPDLTCKSTRASEYCAVSELSTIVQKRVE